LWSKENRKQARELAEKDLFRSHARLLEEMMKHGAPLEMSGFDEDSITFSTAASDQDSMLVEMTIGMRGT
jgi:hypothetical protein